MKNQEHGVVEPRSITLAGWDLKPSMEDYDIARKALKKKIKKRGRPRGVVK